MPRQNAAEALVRARLESPDPARLAALRARSWTGHNIPLAAGVSTMGPEQPLIGDDPRTRTIKSLVRRYLIAREPVRLLDLGSLEGGLAFEMAREGWRVVGVEGRESNLEKAELVRDYFGLENLRFELRDVKTLSPERDGAFDGVLCCGLLYHLDDPIAFLRTLRTVVTPDGFLFVDTHVAPEADGHPTWGSQLSKLVVEPSGDHRYEGRWFQEPTGGSTLDRAWSAVSNARSFWPTRRSLVRALCHAGFPRVLELFGMFDIDREFGLRDQFSRLYLVGLPDF